MTKRGDEEISDREQTSTIGGVKSHGEDLMPYSLELERRMDALVGKLGPVEKKKMFGGIGYMAGGNMCFGIHKDFFILRVSEEKGKELMKSEHAGPFEMTRQPMKGWLQIAPEGVKSDAQLLAMMRLGFDFASSLGKKK